MKGDWKAIKKILNEDHEAMMAKVMTVEHDQFTVLDVAVMFAQDQLVENVIECFPPDYKDFRSALYNAAKGGRIRMVKALVDKVDAEPETVARALSAAVSGAPMQKEVISYLARRTTSAPHYSSSTTLTTLIKTGHLGIPLCLVDTSFDNSNNMKMTRGFFSPLCGGSNAVQDITLEFWHNTRKTLWEALLEQRQKLLKEARQWMKDTSSSCTLIGTLITTVAFAAALAVPEVNDGSMGTSIFPKRGSFMVFAVANALAFLSSVTATLMFLAILTSRYAEEDFLHSLPKKMILGLTFLFLSLAFMIVAFGSALITILSERFKWIYIPITLLASFPVILFAIL
ncbi:hypothetical protein NL676_033644 [Syzygium grande]|nr:hypothetical protein NL676_033644 [Syzygium grande]